MENAKRNVPEIRFPGFTDPWEQRKLSEVTDEFQSGKFIAAADIEEIGEYPVYGGNGLRGYCNTYNHDGDFALIGRQGALCGNMNYSSGKAYFTEHAVAVKANESSNTRFLYYLLDKMNLGQYSDQSAQPGLAVGKLVKLENMFPSKEEQDKIGGFFENLDNLITLHQRKCDELKVFKKGLLQQMFPQPGESIPRVRFPGFTDPWEQRKLGELCDFINGDRSSNYPSATEFTESGISFVGSDSLGSTMVDKAKLRFISLEKYEQMNGLKIEKNDILYTLRGAGFGKCSIADFSGGTVASSLVGIRCKKTLQSLFLIQWLGSANADDEKNKAVNGSTAQNISVEDMKKYIVSMPSIAEQKEISEFLFVLDVIITLHQRKCDELKIYKKGLLQKMFV